MNPLEQFLRQAAQEIRAMPAAVRADELRELRGHLEQRAQDYIGAGMSASEAQTRAVAGLGSARALGTKLCDVWEGVPFRWWRLLAAITGAISLQLMWSLLNFFTAYVHQTAYGNQEEPTLTATRNLWNTLSLMHPLPAFASGWLFSYWLGRRGRLWAVLCFCCLFFVGDPLGIQLILTSNKLIDSLIINWISCIRVVAAFAGALVCHKLKMRALTKRQQNSKRRAPQ